MSAKIDPVVKQWLEAHKPSPEEKARRKKLSQQDWRWEVHLEWFAEHCQSLRQLLKANLTSDGWTWKQDEGYVGSDWRTWKFRYKLLKYEIGRKELVFCIHAYGRGSPARVVSISIERVGHVRHMCVPGADEFERNVDQVVEMVMLLVVSALIGDDNQGYFK